ncbi:MAG TPA: hypothetical protein DEP66_05335 [Acidimicrobiaceae bacterium]|nr:hypothetical protein [Acidimicrobiaceae bacterium]HCB37616.1 hypothetical protein [Acidimicrobiaceae bacterium]
MHLRESTVAGMCLFLTALVWFSPLSFFATVYEGIDNDRVAWSCGIPVFSLSPADVDLDQVRAELAADETDGIVESRHPQCRGLARTQLVLGLLSFAAAVWRGRRWWVSTADRRAERKFTRLHGSFGSASAGKARSGVL